MKIVIVTNIPAPYRLPIYKRLNEKYGDDFLVIYCAKRESNRLWSLDDFGFNYIFLEENFKEKKDGFNYVHNNPDVFKRLKSFNPDIVITTGFNPTHIYAWLYATLFMKRHICMTDGWKRNEEKLSIVHKMVRKIVFRTSKAFIGAGKNSLDLYRSYKIKDEHLFQSHLCIDNDRFKNNQKFDNREYDLMFSGQFIDIKSPLFFADVAHKISKIKKDLKVLILGDGPLKKVFIDKMNRYKIDYRYVGFVEQKELAKYYSSSKLFLFPTKKDAWGVVVNEAMASGTPVVTTPFAGVVDDLVIDKKNGYILDIDSDIWAKKSIEILNSPKLWKELSQNAKESVEKFNFDNATLGIVEACEYSYEK